MSWLKVICGLRETDKKTYSGRCIDNGEVFRITEIDSETFERMTGAELDCLQVAAPAGDGEVYVAIDAEMEDYIEVPLNMFDIGE